ncbi:MULTISPECIES: hypothetical protein [unclassified Xanthomonas]|uniref:hypothetical protein n=1 Tax=Xanthomonas sp. LMG 8992 TaxID=1591157 RepID=UPI00181E8AF0|nr:hypothetical protein [Xanthomonas sp. LMG 8992]
MHAEGVAALDGRATPVKNNFQADVFALQMPAPNVLVMMLSKDRSVASTRRRRGRTLDDRNRVRVRAGRHADDAHQLLHLRRGVCHAVVTLTHAPGAAHASLVLAYAALQRGVGQEPNQFGIPGGPLRRLQHTPQWLGVRQRRYSSGPMTGHAP